MEEKEALIRATPLLSKCGSRVVMVLSLRLLWQYDRAAFTAPSGTLQFKQR